MTDGQIKEQDLFDACTQMYLKKKTLPKLLTA